jgi:hypothetical protein
MREQQLPFDVMATRCIFFDLASTEGGPNFEVALTQAIKEVLSHHEPTVLKSSVQRTESIVRDLAALAALPDDVIAQQTVWFSGFLSSLAISEGEPFAGGEEQYRTLLLQERDLLLSLARRGCALRLIITPPSEGDLVVTDLLPTTVCRLKALLAFLGNSIEAAHEKIYWAISPFRQQNAYIIGQRCYSVGFKVAQQRGYALTVRHTDLDAVSSATKAHEVLFGELRTDTLQRYGPDTTHVQDRDRLKVCAERALHAAVVLCEAKLSRL